MNMRKIFTKKQLGLYISLLLIICSSFMAITEPVMAVSGSVSISPAAQTVRPGDSFDIVVTLNTDIASRGGQCRLNFNSVLVQCDSVTEGSFYKNWTVSNSGSTIVFPQPEIHNDTGKVTDIGIAIMGGDAGGPTGSGEFCIYHMTAKTGVSGTSLITLSNVVLTDENGYDISGVTINNGQVLVSLSATATPDEPTTLTTSTTPSTPVTSATPPTSTTPATTTPAITTTPGTNDTPTATSIPTIPTGSVAQVNILPAQQTGINHTMIDLSGIIDSSGVVQAGAGRGDIGYGEAGWKAKLEITSGTQAVTEDGQPLQQISIQPNLEPPTPPPGDIIIGSAIDLEPSGATFSLPLSVTFEYDPDLLSKDINESEMLLAYFDTQLQEWCKCDYTVDTANHSIIGHISHFTTFSILAEDNSGMGWSLTAIIILLELAAAALVIVFIILKRRSPGKTLVPAQAYNTTALGPAGKKENMVTSQADSLPNEAKPGKANIKTRIEIIDGKFVFSRDDKLPSVVEIDNKSGRTINVSVEYDPDLYPEGVAKITILDKATVSEEPEPKKNEENKST